MTDQDAYLAFSDQYREIDDHLDNLVAAAQSYIQAQAIEQSWQQANLNYLQARNKIFADGSATTEALYKDLVKSNSDIKAALATLGGPAGDIGKVTAAITTGVSAGSTFLSAGKSAASAKPAVLTAKP